MDQLSIVAAAGMRARMESLDMLANNLANAATGGYKNDREFYTLFTGADSDAGSLGSESTLPSVDHHWTDFSQGVLEPTSNPLDMAISGKGFFTVKGTAGPLYTRNGNFRVGPGGALVTAEGYPLLSTTNEPIEIDSTLPVDVAADGSISQKGQAVGQMQLSDFSATASLVKQGGNYFKNVDPKAKPIVTDAEVHQGAIEGSNVKAPESAVRLIDIMRQFEMLQKAISISGDMNKKAIDEVARVS